MIICSKNTVCASVKAGRKINIIYLEKSFDDYNVINIIKHSNVLIKRVDKNTLFDLCETKNHQGIAAEIQDYSYHSIDEILKLDDARVIVLDELNDPHNLGSIIRSADAFSFPYIIIPENNSISLNATVARVSTGSIENIKVIRVSSILKSLQLLKKNGYYIYGTSLNTKLNYSEVNYKKKFAIVFGSEGFGIRPLVLKECDELVTISMSGTTNSLNVSNSAAIIMSWIDLKDRKKD